MSEQMSKKQILELIQSERAAFEVTLAQLSQAQMTRPGPDSDWSGKDILAHLAAWQQKMIQWLQESLRGETPDRPAPGMAWDDLDALNEQLYLENKDKSLAEVLAAFNHMYQQSWQVVENLTEADLLDPDRFEWRRGDPMWHLVAANTWEHYREHRETIDHWLKQME